MNSTQLGKFIASLRNEKNLTQEELADKLFIDKRKISRWECGTSTPEFDMLIKLSEILDVSLYELSICQRIENTKLSKRIINKFKSIDDLKRYKKKKIILKILLSIIIVFIGLTTIYAFNNSGTVRIYEIKSLDSDYRITGLMAIIKDNYYFDINSLQYTGNSDKNIINDLKSKKCDYEIVTTNGKRILYTLNKECIDGINCINNYDITFSKKFKNITNGTKLALKINCEKENSKDFDKLSIEFKLQEIYNNSFFKNIF